MISTKAKTSVLHRLMCMGLHGFTMIYPEFWDWQQGQTEEAKRPDTLLLATCQRLSFYLRSKDGHIIGTEQGLVEALHESADG